MHSTQNGIWQGLVEFFTLRIQRSIRDFEPSLQRCMMQKREHSNVPILEHYDITECYAYQSSQIGVTESSGNIEGFYWARLASFIIKIHSAQLGFGSVAFRRFP
jgi:hypothetical protein